MTGCRTRISASGSGSGREVADTMSLIRTLSIRYAWTRTRAASPEAAAQQFSQQGEGLRRVEEERGGVEAWPMASFPFPAHQSGFLVVTRSKPPAEHPISHVMRQNVLLSLVRAPALPPQHTHFGSQFHSAPTFGYALDPASP